MANMISIIVPIYNAEDTIARLIESIVNQTYTDWELLLINDSSTDNTQTICEEFSLRDSRIKFLQNIGSGVSSARNLGIDKSKGNYIFFVDADDAIEPDTLIKLVQFDADVVRSGFKKIFPSGEKASQNNVFLGKYNKEEICNTILPTFSGGSFWSPNEPSVFCNIWGTLIKKDCLEDIRFRCGMEIMEDKLFLLELLQKINSIYFYAEPLYCYYLTSNSAMGRYHSSYTDDTLAVAEYLHQLSLKNSGVYDRWVSFSINSIWNIANNEALSPVMNYKKGCHNLRRMDRYLKFNGIKINVALIQGLLKRSILWLFLLSKQYRLFLYIWHWHTNE